MYCSLLWLTLRITARISISHLSIPGIVAHGRCYMFHCFYFSPVRRFKSFSMQCLYPSNVHKPDQFLFLIKISFFSNLSFWPSFNSLLLLLSLLFLLLLLLFSCVVIFNLPIFFSAFTFFKKFFYMFCFAIIFHFHCTVMSRYH